MKNQKTERESHKQGAVLLLFTLRSHRDAKSRWFRSRYANWTNLMRSPKTARRPPGRTNTRDASLKRHIVAASDITDGFAVWSWPSPFVFCVFACHCSAWFVLNPALSFPYLHLFPLIRGRKGSGLSMLDLNWSCRCVIAVVDEGFAVVFASEVIFSSAHAKLSFRGLLEENAFVACLVVKTVLHACGKTIRRETKCFASSFYTLIKLAYP